MAWVPIQLSSKPFTFSDTNGGNPAGSSAMIDSIITASTGGTNWTIDAIDGELADELILRLTFLEYSTDADVESFVGSLSWYDSDNIEHTQFNENMNPSSSFSPNVVEATVGAGNALYYWQSGEPPTSPTTDANETFQVFVEVWEGPVAEAASDFSQPALAFELDRGWSFDGEYIPHFLELNWFFGEDPVTYKSVNKIRIHGLVKGVVNLQVQLSGMQGDVTTDYIEDYMQPEFLDFPFTPIHVQQDFVPATNYVDYSDRGIALQMKFEGRNQNVLLPEPAHVIQVLALQSSPQGNGKRAQ